MINPVSSSSVTAFEAAQVHNTASAKQPANNPPQDTVKLSPQALSAGDVDHDGDSH